jgi:Na+/melibiose symporter-like transporter
MTFLRLLAALLFVVAAPAAALACPVCGLAGPGNNGWAYLAMTIMMSVVPLAFIGGVVFWVYRRTSAEPVDAALPTGREIRP